MWWEKAEDEYEEGEEEEYDVHDGGFFEQPQVVTKTLESATQKHNQHRVIRKKKKK
jgi:hypothetical protein